MTVNWSVTGLERSTDTDTVFKVIYGLELVVDGDQKYLLTDCEYTVDGENTIPFENLTPEICLGWVRDGLGSEGIAEREAYIDSLYTPYVGQSDTLPTNWPT